MRRFRSATLAALFSCGNLRTPFSGANGFARSRLRGRRRRRWSTGPGARFAEPGRLGFVGFVTDARLKQGEFPRGLLRLQMRL